VLWVLELTLQAYLDFYTTGELSSSYLLGELLLTLEILGWEFASGTSFELYPDHLVIDGHIFGPWSESRADTLRFMLTRESIGGSFPNGLELGGFVDVPDGSVFHIEPDDCAGGEQCPLHVNFDYHGIPCEVELSEVTDPRAPLVDGVYVSCGSSGTIQLAGENWGVSYGPSGVEAHGPVYNACYSAAGGERIVHVWGDETRTTRGPIEISLSGTEQSDALELWVVAGERSGGRDVPLLAEYEQGLLEGGHTYSATLGDNQSLTSLEDEAGGASYGVETWSPETGEGYFAIQSISPDLDDGADILHVQVTTSHDSYCCIQYGEEEPLEYVSETHGPDMTHDVVITDDSIQDGWYYRAAVTNADSTYTIYSATLVASSDESPVEGCFFATLTAPLEATLRWTVPSLSEVAGFHVYRGTNADGPYARITDEPLPPVSPGECVDTDLWPGTTFWYELRAILVDGTEDVVGPSLASVTTGGELRAVLYPPQPNPTARGATLDFLVPNYSSHAQLVVYGIKGNVVKILRDGRLPAGRHSVVWNGTDANGRRVGPGVYFVQLTLDGESLRTRVTVVR